MREPDTGGRLAILRRSRMWTQGRLAEEAGISPTTVSGIESGRIPRPHLGTVGKLARALGVDPGELLSPDRAEAGEGQAPLSLEWARASSEEEFERRIEEAPLEHLRWLSGELDGERGRLQELYGRLSGDSDQRRLIKRRIRDVSARSGSVSTSMMFHEETVGSDTPERGAG